MNKALSIFLLLIVALPILGQKTQPSAKRPKADQPVKQPKSSNQKSTKQQAVSVAKKPTTTKPRPKPAVTPPGPEDERADFDRALAAPTAAEKARLLRVFVDKFPNSEYRDQALDYLVTARAIVGNDLLQSGDVSAGISSFKLAVREAPVPVPDRLFNDVIAKIPASLFYRDQRAAAVDLAQIIEKKVAAYPKQLLGVAAFYLGIENGAEAVRLAEAAVASDENFIAGYQALGLAYRLNFDLEEAARAYSKAVELDPSSASAQRSLAEMKRALGKPDEAVTIYQSLLASNENDEIARGGLILSLFDSGKQAEAEAELARETERGSKNFGLFAGAAYWYAANNIGHKAVEFAQKAIDIEPRYIWGHIAYARGLMKRNKPVEAERALIKARQYGNFPTLEYELASARFKAGLFREAVEELNKSFDFQDGFIRTRLGGRIYKEDKSFQDLLAGERRASILQPTPADDLENSARLRILFEITKKLGTSPDETEITALADEFVRGDDKMKLHRQLYMANVLLQKNVALDKAAEFVKASVGNVEAGLDVSAPGAAVMASELYESRTIAFSRNEVLVIPEVPRQTLSAILRGRIEELAGWTLYQQKNYPDAVVRLRRAISVLPEKSAWWRSSVWRLGAALEAEGKEKEALEHYIKSYVTDRPNALRYGVIEGLYRRVNGHTEGLEEKIGPNPLAAIAATPTQKDNTQKPAVSSAALASPKDIPSVDSPGIQADPIKPPPRHLPVKIATERPADKLTASTTDAKAQTETKPDIVPGNEKLEIPAVSEPKNVEEKPASDSTDKNEEARKEPTTVVPPQTAANKDKTVEDRPAADIPKAADTTPVSTESIAAQTVVDTKASGQKSETSSTQPKNDALPSVETKTESATGKEPVETKVAEPQVPANDVVNVKQADPNLKQPDGPLKTGVAETKTDEVNNQKVSVATAKTSTENNADTPAKTPPIKEDVTDSGLAKTKKTSDADTPELSVETTAKTDAAVKGTEAETVPKTDSTVKDASKAEEPANLLRDPFTEAEPDPKKPEPPEKKPLIVVDDPFKPEEKTLKTDEKAPKTKDLFEPVIISIPRGTPAQKQTEKDVSGKNESPGAKKPEIENEASGVTRRRLIEGKEVTSDQKCSIEVSQESIMLLSGGGSLGLLVSVTGDGAIKDITATTTSTQDIEVRPEPELEGVTGRRFYVIKSISPKPGIYQVNFESPCGKREITVHVR